MERIRLDSVSKRFSRGSGTKTLLASVSGISWFQSEWFLALDQVNLAIPDSGVCLGIIGPNGSGKTTLLRIIAGVTAPTQGKVMVRGQVVPLLEASAGMQPELTGRENIFLNGIILGMRRREIQRKLDSIVEFSGVDKFLDMPLKHYSLGMVTRLGFSVASHVDANILLVDESWSMADASFQTKSFSRLTQLRKRGGILLLVSHDPNLIRRLADQVLWLQNGRVVRMGPTEEILKDYLSVAGLP